MIKLTYCIFRKPELSQAEFFGYWQTTHADLFLGLADDMFVHKYIQCHAMDSAATDALGTMRGTLEHHDGISELWWTDEDWERAGKSEKAAAAGAILVEDEARFIDFSRSHIWLNREHVFLDRG